MVFRNQKLIALSLVCALFAACVTTSLPPETETAYGKSFKCSYRDGQPYTGQVVYQAAADYYWVTDYREGKFVIQNHYHIVPETKEHRLMFVKETEDGTVSPVNKTPGPLGGG